MKNESQRQKRVAEQVKQIVARGFYTSNLAGTDLATRITITKVNISKDLKHGQVFYTLLGGYIAEEDIVQTTDILNTNTPDINTFVAKNMATKYTPKLRFFYDHAFEEANRVERLLDEVVPEPNSERGSGTG